MAEKGAHIKKGPPVQKASKEGPLDQNLGVSVDGNMQDFVFLDSVTDENDVFNRCPVRGNIDGSAELGKQSIKAILEALASYTSNLYVNPTGDGFKPIAESGTDRFAVTDAEWMDDPNQLIWKSSLLAQLQAKLNAVTHFLNDPSALDFGGNMSEEDKKIVAQRARELAAALQDEALNDIDSKVAEANTKMAESVSKSKARFMQWTVDDPAAKAAGGLTEDEVNELFQGGE